MTITEIFNFLSTAIFGSKQAVNEASDFNTKRAQEIQPRVNMLTSLASVSNRTSEEEAMLRTEALGLQRKVMELQAEEKVIVDRLKSSAENAERAAIEAEVAHREKMEEIGKVLREKEKEVEQKVKLLEDVTKQEMEANARIRVQESQIQRMERDMLKQQAKLEETASQYKMQLAKLDEMLLLKTRKIDELARKVVTAEVTTEEMMRVAPHEATGIVVNSLLKSDITDAGLRHIREGMKKMDEMTGGNKDEILKEFESNLPSESVATTMVDSVKNGIILNKARAKALMESGETSVKVRLGRLEKTPNELPVLSKEKAKEMMLS